jgi:hypothetical protein
MGKARVMIENGNKFVTYMKRQKGWKRGGLRRLTGPPKLL